MLVELKISEFLNVLQSDSPAPGGGSCAALAGAVGAALGVMVGRLTVGNDKYAAVSAEAQELLTTLSTCQKTLEKYIDEDTEAFNKVMAAYKLPKATDEEKAARSAAIQMAMKGAAQLPFEVAKLSAEVMEMAMRMLAIGNSNAASDAAVAGRMAHTATWSAVYNVRINLGSIKDKEFSERLKEETDALVKKVDALLVELAAKADETI